MRSSIQKVWPLFSSHAQQLLRSSTPSSLVNACSLEAVGSLPPRFCASSLWKQRVLHTAVHQSAWKYWANNYKQLSKLKLSSFVVLSAGAGFVAGSGASVDWLQLAWTSLGTLGAAASANALNQIYEIKNDGRMHRTSKRPLPGGRMSRAHAAVFAAVVGAAGLWVLYTQTNELTAALGATNIALYAAIYTPLKQITLANTWVGAVVGAIPPLMGWSAAAGQLDPGAFVIALALFSWQMPHFLSLAWLYKEDYIRGGFRMLSMFDPLGRRTAAISMRYICILALIGPMAVVTGVTSWPFALETAALAGLAAWPTLKFRQDVSPGNARSLFRGSLMYLPILLTALVVHRTPEMHVHSMAELSDRVQHLLHADAVASPKLALPAPTESSGLFWDRALTRGPLASTAQRMEEACRKLIAELADVPFLTSSFKAWLLSWLDSYRLECPSKVYCDPDDGETGSNEAMGQTQNHPQTQGDTLVTTGAPTAASR